LTAVPLTGFFGDELIELHHPAQHWASLKCFACSALQPWIASSTQSFCQLCSKRGGAALCTLQSLVNGAFPACKKAICGLSQNRQSTAVQAGSTTVHCFLDHDHWPRSHLWRLTRWAKHCCESSSNITLPCCRYCSPLWTTTTSVADCRAGICSPAC